MQFLKYTFISTFAFLSIAPAQEPENDNGLPPGWEQEAEQTVLGEATGKVKSQAAPEATTYDSEDVKMAMDAMPAGKYIGKLPAELYLQLADGNEAERALQLLKKWEDDGTSPLVNFNGKLRYVFESGTPLIVTKTV